MNRRRAIGAGAASIAAMAMFGSGAAQDEESSIEVVAGGGAVETALGLVDFGLIAQANSAGEVSGAMMLRDFTQPGNPVVMQSTQFNRLAAPSGDAPTARELVGWVSAGGSTAIFLLQVDDVDGPGTGEDVFRLYVGEAAAPFLDGEEQSACDCADYSYTLAGRVVQGDILVVTS